MMRRFWSVAEVVVLGAIASCVLMTGCDDHRKSVHRGDERRGRVVVVERDRHPREREVVITREAPRHQAPRREERREERHEERHKERHDRH